jgi:uncharacterized membrane protein (DUF373 family)
MAADSDLIVSGMLPPRGYSIRFRRRINAGIMNFWRWIYPERYQNVTMLFLVRLGIILISIVGVLFLLETFYYRSKKRISTDVRMIGLLFFIVCLSCCYLFYDHFLDWSVILRNGFYILHDDDAVNPFEFNWDILRKKKIFRPLHIGCLCFCDDFFSKSD